MSVKARWPAELGHISDRPYDVNLINGVAYFVGTPPTAIPILENLRQDPTHPIIRIHRGNPMTGKLYGKKGEYDLVGYITQGGRTYDKETMGQWERDQRRSGGVVLANPLWVSIHNPSRSWSTIIEADIIRISREKDGTILWEHPQISTELPSNIIEKKSKITRKISKNHQKTKLSPAGFGELS